MRLWTRLAWTSLALVFLAGVAAPANVVAQPASNSITNFRAVNVSNAELWLRVDYTFAGLPADSPVTINATPEERGGVFDPRLVDVDEVPVTRGTRAATLAIRKRPAARDFTSSAIRVCLSTASAAVLCQDFPFTKAWSNSTSPPPPPPPDSGTTPQPAQTCSISGEVTGQLVFNTKDDRGQPATFTLRDIVLTAPDGTRQRAALKNRQYVFANLPAGVEYRVFPANFRAKPNEMRVMCQPKGAHRANFFIVGPPLQG